MKRAFTYPVVIHQSKYGFDVSVPALPGCHSQGETEEEALANIQDAISTYLESEQNDLVGSKVREVTVTLTQ